MIGRDVSVLFERTGRLPGQMVGKSEYLHPVFVDDADVKIGDIAQVRIISTGTNSLEGKVVR